jgi:hypothetical protein
LLYQSARGAMKVTAVIIEEYHCNQLHTKFIPYSFLKIKSIYTLIDEIIGDHQCGFRRNRSTTDQMFSLSSPTEEKWEYSQRVHQLYVDFRKVYDSVRREVLYNILIELWYL